MKFGFGRANRAKLFEEFARYNARLRELLDTSDRSAALKQSRLQLKNSAVKKVFWKLWRHAASLHEVLCQAWCCQCKHLHLACLALHHESNIEHIEFSICFLYSPSLTAEGCPWSSKDVNAQHVNRDGSVSLVATQDSVAQPSAPTASSKSSIRNLNLPPLPSRHKVSWADPPPAADTTPQATEPTVITDLCSTIATCDPTNKVFGLLEGDEDSYVLQSGAKTRPPGDAYKSVTLENLLNKSSGLRRLDRRQRYRIAFTLASSHLQLYPSPWLHSHWSKKDIIFNIYPGRFSSYQLEEQPYMLRAVSTQTATSPTSYASSDRALATLGILLIELCFGTPLEDHEMRRQYDSSREQQAASPDLAAALDLAVALEWAHSVRGEAGEMYADAVDWCLKGRSVSARDGKWRQELFANVVRPLQFCYEQLDGKGGIEDWLKPGLLV